MTSASSTKQRGLTGVACKNDVIKDLLCRMAEYLFAYGSLIGSSTRSETDEGEKIPVKVIGLKRGWYIPVPEDRNTGLGIVFQEDAECNGVLIRTNESHLSDTDLRETQHGYKRAPLSDAALTLLDINVNRSKIDHIWVYLVNNPILPTNECPIAQSYLDVVLTGCLEINEKFAAEFIQTTDGWDSEWINDRQRPRYRRAISADAAQIDELIRKIIPVQLSKRKDLNK